MKDGEQSIDDALFFPSGFTSTLLFESPIVSFYLILTKIRILLRDVSNSQSLFRCFYKINQDLRKKKLFHAHLHHSQKVC